MRPQQQNRRMRGRNNNNNRRGPNPLTRTYESNGPDVKIRGSAQQIAEKYATLARDAQSSGDRVMAENYLQHAEHYNRIIAAAQAQMPIQNFQQPRNDIDDDLDEDGEEFAPQQNGNGMQPHGNGGQPPQQQHVDSGAGPQPIIEGTPAEVALNPEAASAEGESEEQRQPRFNGNHQPESEDENAGFRRPRRPRRGRGRGANADAGEAGGQRSDAESGNAVAASEAPAAPAEAPARQPSDGPSFEPVEN